MAPISLMITRRIKKPTAPIDTRHAHPQKLCSVLNRLPQCIDFGGFIVVRTRRDVAKKRIRDSRHKQHRAAESAIRINIKDSALSHDTFSDIFSYMNVAAASSTGCDLIESGSEGDARTREHSKPSLRASFDALN